MRTSGMRDGPWRDSGADRGEAMADGACGRWRRRDPGPNGNKSSGRVGDVSAGLAAHALEIRQRAVALQRLHATEGGAVSRTALTCKAEDRELRWPEKTHSRIHTVCAKCSSEARPLAVDAGRKRRKKTPRQRAVRKISPEQVRWKEEELPAFQD